MTSPNSKVSTNLILVFVGAGALIIGGFLFFRCRSDVSGLSYCYTLGLGNARAYFRKANERFANEDYQGAIADYNKAIEINPQLATAYKNRGITKELIDDLTGACADWRKASSLGVQDAFGWVRDQCQ